MNREDFFHSLPLDSYRPEELLRVQHAYWMAKEGHRKQKRDGGQRYFEHPRGVALILIELGYTDWRTICAALLHDGLEDTYIQPSIYMSLLGATVYNWIETLSKATPQFDLLTGKVTGYVKKTLEDYFKALSRANVLCRVVKLADRLHNLRSIPDSWPHEKVRRQIDETRQFLLPIARATDERFVDLINIELDRLEARIA